jgi:SAM-dependent methyltransferase
MSAPGNAAAYEAWNGDSGHRWATDADRRDLVLAPVADVLLAAAGLREGDALLDIGCGCGATTVAAARLVGPSGAVCGIDVSAPMLNVARQRLEGAGLSNSTLVQGDAQSHELPRIYDAAISRFGTMFFSDPVGAFVNITRALQPNGQLCLATWQPLVANDWLTIPGAALLRYGTLPDNADGGPGMFAQSDAAAVTATLRTAGYRDVELEPVTVTLTLGANAEDATDVLASSGVGRAVLDTVPDPQRPAALDAVRATLADLADADGVRLAAAVWIVQAGASA